MKKIKLILTLFITLLLYSCKPTVSGNQNVGYNTPSLSTFSITFNLYTTNEKNESFILKSEDIPTYTYNLLRIDEEHVYLGVKIDDILQRKKLTIHPECVIFGDNSNEETKTMYSSTHDLYIAIYQNNNGPWDLIDKLYGPAILVDLNDIFNTYTTKLKSFNAILTQE